MTEPLPAPPVPPDVDLRGFEFMPFYGDRLFKSETWIAASPEAKVAALRLWWQAYGHEVPAASLPDNDTLLAEYAGYGVAVKVWLKLKPQAMRGWVKCSDGRLYHPFVADLVKEAWERRKAQRDRTEKARLARLSQNQLQKPKESVTENVTTSVTASTGQDRTGQDSTSKATAQQPPPVDNLKATLRGALAAALRAEGVTGITPSNPLLVQWVERGVTVQHAREAVDLARERKPKPEKIPAAYLDPIIAQLLGGGRAPVSRVNGVPAPDWWQSKAGIFKKARQEGITPDERDLDGTNTRCAIAAKIGLGPWIDQRNFTEMRIYGQEQARAKHADPA